MTAKSRWEKFIILTQSPQNVTPIFLTGIWVWEVVYNMGPSFADNWQKGTSHVHYWKEVFIEVSSKQEWGLWRYVTVDVSWIHHYHTTDESAVSTVGGFFITFSIQWRNYCENWRVFCRIRPILHLCSLQQYRWNKCINLRGDYVLIRIWSFPFIFNIKHRYLSNSLLIIFHRT